VLVLVVSRPMLLMLFLSSTGFIWLVMLFLSEHSIVSCYPIPRHFLCLSCVVLFINFAVKKKTWNRVH
jgi:hypothetical protein